MSWVEWTFRSPNWIAGSLVVMNNVDPAGADKAWEPFYYLSTGNQVGICLRRKPDAHVAMPKGVWTIDGVCDAGNSGSLLNA